MTTNAKPTKKARLLQLLKDRRYHTSNELLKAGGYRYGARLHNLRSDGYVFSVKQSVKSPSLFQYRLVSKPKTA